MAEISKITLPSGNTYDLKDTIARSMIAGGISFNIVWTKTQFESTTAPTSTVLSNIPKDVVVYYNNGSSSATGTKVAASSTKGAFYLIYSKTQSGVLDKFDEYATIEDGSTFFWEKIGDTQIDLSSLGNLAYKDSVTINNYTNHKVAVLTGASNSSSNVTFADNTTNVDKVLGEATTFTNSSSSVSFSGGTTDKVLGEATTFALSDGAVSFGSLSGKVETVPTISNRAFAEMPTITVTPTTTNIKATASGTAVGANGTAKTLGTNATFSTTVTPTTTNIKATASGTALSTSTSKAVSTSNLESKSVVESVSSAKLATTSVPNVESVTSKTLTLALGTGNDSETLIISGTGFDVNNVYTADQVSMGTDITVATGGTKSSTSPGSGAILMTGVNSTAYVVGITDNTTGIVDIDAITSASVGTQPTISLTTGATAGTGVISVATGINSATTTTNSKDEKTVLTGVKVTSQPTVALATDATAGTGVISVATGISSATASGVSTHGLSVTFDDQTDIAEAIVTMPTASVGTGITVGTNDKVTAVTGIGTGTAAAQTITVGTNDKVDVLKKGATGTAAAQTITPTTTDVLKAESGITAS